MAIDIFAETRVFENDRVLLRPLEASDLVYLLPFSLQEPEIWKYGLVTAAGEDNLRNYIQTAVANRAAQKEYAFIVYDKLM